MVATEEKWEDPTTQLNSIPRTMDTKIILDSMEINLGVASFLKVPCIIMVVSNIKSFLRASTYWMDLVRVRTQGKDILFYFIEM